MAKKKDKAEKRKLWPTEVDLLAWFLFIKLDEQDHVMPDEITAWLIEYHCRPAYWWHRFVWNAGIDEFQERYEEPA